MSYKTYKDQDTLNYSIQKQQDYQLHWMLK